MITDTELVNLMQDKEVLGEVMELKKAFLKAEADFLDVGDDDFVSIVLMAPSVGVALANGTISLFEQLVLNRKARFMSRGSYFRKADPIEAMLKYLIEHFSEWEDRFYNLIKLTLYSSIKKNEVIYQTLHNPESSTGSFSRDVLNAPYIFVKFISFLFLGEEDDLMNYRVISAVELEKIKQIGAKLDIAEIPVFKSFCDTFEVVSES